MVPTLSTLLIILTIIIPPSNGLSFNFTTFTAGQSQNITYEQAFPADNAIQLTKNLLGSDLKFSFGRATYHSPLPLWDPISRNLTDFQTHFTFTIFSQFKEGYGDGLAFFLAPKGSKLPPGLTEGGSMGLTRDLQQLNTSGNRFVAVEFDIFSNSWDPVGKHEELLLVYEFLTNGSLDLHLFKQKDVNLLLNWETRYKIAKGLASGMLYLHEEWEQCVVHRDIKSSNVMLDSNFRAKLGDFGLARLVDHDKGSQTTMLAGTIGYVAPECAMTGKASRESDIYSFGVVALEIATGRKPAVMMKLENQCFVHLVKWVWDLYSERTMLEQGPDSRLGGQFVEVEMERLMLIGLCCSHPDPKLRPSIRQALQVLNFEAPLPIVPMNMPVATFVSAPSSMDGTTTSTSSSLVMDLTRSIDISNTMAR
ncbi:L-type lectin-domain containing receptor kinase IX.1 [Linum perenne]